MRTKTIRKAYKYRLIPTSEQRQKMVEFAGINRFVWNKALALNLYRLENKLSIMWYAEMDFWSKSRIGFFCLSLAGLSIATQGN